MWFSRFRTRPAAALGLVALFLAIPSTATEQVVDGIAAQVGSDIVLISDVDQISAPLEAEMRQAGLTDSEIAMMRAEALERLIEGKIIDHVVKRTELSIDEAELDSAITKIAEENGLTLNQLASGVSAHGIPFATYRKQIKHEIERSKVLNTMIRSRIRVEPEEVEKIYLERYGDQHVGGDQVHLRHIMMPAGAGVLRGHADACPVLEKERAKIVAGKTSFVEVARKYSAIKAESGGDIGWIHGSDVAAWMAPTLESLGDGEVSPVIATNFGCNLLLVVERKGHSAITLDEVGPEIYQEVFQGKTEEEYARWIDTLRDQTYIQRKGLFSETSRLLQETKAAP